MSDVPVLLRSKDIIKVFSEAIRKKDVTAEYSDYIRSVSLDFLTRGVRYCNDLVDTGDAKLANVYWAFYALEFFLHLSRYDQVDIILSAVSRLFDKYDSKQVVQALTTNPLIVPGFSAAKKLSALSIKMSSLNDERLLDLNRLISVNIFCCEQEQAATLASHVLPSLVKHLVANRFQIDKRLATLCFDLLAYLPVDSLSAHLINQVCGIKKHLKKYLELYLHKTCAYSNTAKFKSLTSKNCALGKLIDHHRNGPGDLKTALGVETSTRKYVNDLLKEQHASDKLIISNIDILMNMPNAVCRNACDLYLMLKISPARISKELNQVSDSLSGKDILPQLLETVSNGIYAGANAFYFLMMSLRRVVSLGSCDTHVIVSQINACFDQCDDRQLGKMLNAAPIKGRLRGVNAWYWLTYFLAQSAKSYDDSYFRDIYQLIASAISRTRTDDMVSGFLMQRRPGYYIGNTAWNKMVSMMFSLQSLSSKRREMLAQLFFDLLSRIPSQLGVIHEEDLLDLKENVSVCDELTSYIDRKVALGDVRALSKSGHLLARFIDYPANVFENARCFFGRKKTLTRMHVEKQLEAHKALPQSGAADKIVQGVVVSAREVEDMATQADASPVTGVIVESVAKNQFHESISQPLAPDEKTLMFINVLIAELHTLPQDKLTRVESADVASMLGRLDALKKTSGDITLQLSQIDRQIRELNLSLTERRFASDAAMTETSTSQGMCRL